MTEAVDALALARKRGRMKAERLDQELRAEEDRERRERIALLLGEQAPDAAGNDGDPLAGIEVWRLRQDVERLSAFHGAVLGSRAWRAIQWLRRPLGREW